MKCPFCNIDNTKIENIILFETDNFYVLPAVGSLVDGYLLITTKRHIKAMSLLEVEEQKEYLSIIMRYRKIFKDIYGIEPMVLEHGSPSDIGSKASSVLHAHTHIINYQFVKEKNYLREYNFRKRLDIENISKTKNYVLYINQKGDYYVSYNFPSESQLMRHLIALELGMVDKYDWKKDKFVNNIYKTIIKQLTYDKSLNFKINNKMESIDLIKKLGLNRFPEELFFNNQEDKVREFLIKYPAEYYAIRDKSRNAGNFKLKVPAREVLEEIEGYEVFTINISSFNYADSQLLVGEIEVLSNDMVYAVLSIDPAGSVRTAVSHPDFNIKTNIFDKCLDDIPYFDIIYTYIVTNGLKDIIVEFALFKDDVGIKKEKVIVYELRTNY